MPEQPSPDAAPRAAVHRVPAMPPDLFPANVTRVAYRRGRVLRRYERALIDWLGAPPAAA